jgi:diguanylate cyclase (GGDEF)-like protein/PAS domain S-box-containing protein
MSGSSERNSEANAVHPATDHHFRALFEASPDAIFLVDGDTILDANPAAVELVRAPSKETLLAYAVTDFWPSSGGEDQPDIADWFSNAYEQGRIQYTTRRIRLDGTSFEVEVTLSRVDLPDGPILQGVVRDVTRQNQAERARDQLIEVVEASPDVILIASPEGAVEYLNAGARQMLGLTHADGTTANLASLRPGWAQAVFCEQAVPVLQADGLWKGESAFLDWTGNELPVLETIVAHFDETGSKMERLSSIAQDISEQKRAEGELAYLADHDRLTGLFNRAKLYEFLHQVKAEQQRYGTPYCLIMMDIDQFKAINDRLGHQTGDTVLQEVVRRVHGALRSTDTMGRWGGEEFLILVPQTGLEGAKRLAQRLLRELTDGPIRGVGLVTASFGVAEARPDESLESLEKRVDGAMLTAKAAGRQTIQLAD